MFNYEVTKDMTPAKIKTQSKADLFAYFAEVLTERGSSCSNYQSYY